MKRAWAGWLLFACLGSALPAQAEPVVRYCDYPVYPPVSWTSADGEVRGLAPRVVREVVERLGLTLEIVVLGNWQRCLVDAEAGRVDVVIAYRSAARERFLDYSPVPILREEVALFYRRDRSLVVHRLEDLANYRGGLLVGESYGPDFDRFVAEHGNVERVASNRQNFTKLIRGRIDFIAHQRLTGQLVLEQLEGAERVAVLPEPLAIDHLYLAVSERSPLATRMAEITRLLERLRDEGAFDRWFAESERAYRTSYRQELDTP